MTTTLAGRARRGLRAAACILVLALLAACSPGNAVAVKYEGYSIQPARSTMKAGDMVFNLNNQDGQVPHEFLVVQSDTPGGQLTVGADGKVDETSLNIVGRVAPIELGQSGTLSAHLAPGHYILMCNIVGHYQLGMHADFTVTR